MSKHIYKSHNKTLLLYHMVFPTKYLRKIFDDAADKILKEIYLEINERYEIHFVEIGNNVGHVYFLIQSVPTLALTRIVTIIKSVTAREIFAKHKRCQKSFMGRKSLDKWVLRKYSRSAS